MTPCSMPLLLMPYTLSWRIWVLPIALWDWQQIGFPLLLQTQALPQWVNASLWGIMGVVGCDVLYTTLALVVRTPLGNILPPWVRTLPLAVSVRE